MAYLAQRQRDRVGIITFDNDIVTHVPPSAKHFNVTLHTLDRARAERPGNLGVPLNKMAEHFKRRGILDPDLRLLRGAGRGARGDQAAQVPRQRADRLSRARSRGAGFRLRRCAPASRTSRPASRSRSCPSRCATKYRAMIRAHIEALTTKFSEHRIDYTLLNTAEPLDRALFSYLIQPGKADART